MAVNGTQIILPAKNNAQNIFFDKRLWLMRRQAQIKPAVRPIHPPRQLVNKEDIISIMVITKKAAFTDIRFHFHKLKLKATGITHVRYEARSTRLGNGPDIKPPAMAL